MKVNGQELYTKYMNYGGYFVNPLHEHPNKQHMNNR